jgi:phosphatidate cytidylyltransferase
MLRQRVIVAAILLPTGLFLIHLGGHAYQGAILLLLILSAWEYYKLLVKIQLKPALFLVWIGVILFTVSRSLYSFSYNSILLTLFLFGSAAYHIFQHERDDGNPAVNFGATLSIILYVGFLGAYLISLRSLPDGKWWTFLVLPVVWIADTAAFAIGKGIGKHKLAPKTSPNKTWEGYLAGILAGILGGMGISILFLRVFDNGINITLLQSAFLGGVISAAIPLGDLTESMIKRQASSKDSGNLFPGHGGVFDRIDSLFWAAPIGYYLILHIILQ